MVERDTSPEAHRVQVEVLRRLGERHRTSVALQLSDDLRAALLARIRRDQPELDERAQIRLLVSKLYGEDLATRAYGSK